MKTLRIAAFAAVFAGLAAAEEKAPAAKPVVVPFETLKSVHMAVKVKVNGKGPFLLIFDTGAPTSLINNELAEEAGLFKGKLKTPFTFMGSQGAVKIKKLEVGDQVAEDTDAIIHWCQLALVKSGTVTLQVAKHNRPMVVFYRKSNPILFLLARTILSTTLFSLPNVLPRRRIVPVATTSSPRMIGSKRVL